MENDQTEQVKKQNIFSRPYIRYILIALVIVVLGGGSSLAIYFREKNKSNKELDLLNTTLNQPSSPSPSETITETVKTTTPATTASKNPTTTPASSVTTIQDAGAVEFKLKTAGYCRALAPENWAIITNADGSGADLFSPDQTLHAGWGIAATYTYLSGDPDQGFFDQWMPLAGFAGFTFINSKDIGYDFKQRDFTSSGKKGTVIYKTYTIDSTSYINSVYMADTTSEKWDSQGATPFLVATSIRCTTQLRPSTSDSTGSASSRENNSDIDLSEKRREATMGYENVYSPTTGEHYEAPSNSYNSTGPDGPGYYRSIPNGVEKLESGFGDY